MEETQFPAENLYADPDNVCYARLHLNKSLANFSQKSTPEMLVERWKKAGGGGGGPFVVYFHTATTTTRVFARRNITQALNRGVYT